MSASAHEHGSLADEAARLVEAFGQAAAGWSRGTGDNLGAQDPAGAQPTACRACPLCQVLARVQGSRPELVAHLADAASSLAAALAELTGPREPAPRPRPAREDTVHIDIGD